MCFKKEYLNTLSLKSGIMIVIFRYVPNFTAATFQDSSVFASSSIQLFSFIQKVRQLPQKNYNFYVCSSSFST